MLAGIFLAAGESENALVAYSEQGTFAWATPRAGESADKFLLKFFIGSTFKRVFINAALSLPAAYTQPRHHQDYYYRQSDKVLKLPSPLEKGMQTALAIRMRFMLESQGISVHETVPRVQAARLRKDLEGYWEGAGVAPVWLDLLQQAWPGSLPVNAPLSWARFDALLVLLAAYRHQAGLSSSYGNEQEGFIII